VSPHWGDIVMTVFFYKRVTPLGVGKTSCPRKWFRFLFHPNFAFKSKTINLMSTHKQTHKLSDEQFLEAYRACEGNCAKTARYIHLHFNMYYTKQAVHSRAQYHPQEVVKFYRLLDNDSTTTLMKFADDESNDIRLRARLYIQIMNKADRIQRLNMLTTNRKRFS
jgi:hypothetical protein